MYHLGERSIDYCAVFLLEFAPFFDVREVDDIRSINLGDRIDFNAARHFLGVARYFVLTLQS